jgi:hypothetical protein
MPCTSVLYLQECLLALLQHGLCACASRPSHETKSLQQVLLCRLQHVSRLLTTTTFNSLLLLQGLQVAAARPLCATEPGCPA